MTEREKTLIMKFGGASIKEANHFHILADLIVKRSLTFSNIAVVVSAMGGMTDQLIALAKEVNPVFPTREYDMLVSVGERISISLLSMAMASKGRKAISFTGSQSGIITTNAHSEAKIIDVKPYRILKEWEEKKVVIIAGFQGVSKEKEITTLGRGGSDTTAVALGIALGAEKVEFYKDVEGIFSKDPKKTFPTQLHQRLNFDEALKIVVESGGKVLHPRAIHLAKQNGLPLEVLSFKENDRVGTRIVDPFISRKEEPMYEQSLSADDS